MSSSADGAQAGPKADDKTAGGKSAAAASAAGLTGGLKDGSHKFHEGMQKAPGSSGSSATASTASSRAPSAPSGDVGGPHTTSGSTTFQGGVGTSVASKEAGSSAASSHASQNKTATASTGTKTTSIGTQAPEIKHKETEKTLTPRPYQPAVEEHTSPD